MINGHGSAARPKLAQQASSTVAMHVTGHCRVGLKPAEESSDISVISGSLLGAPDDQLVAGNLPTVAGAHKIGQIGRPQGEHGAVAVFQHV